MDGNPISGIFAALIAAAIGLFAGPSPAAAVVWTTNIVTNGAINSYPGSTISNTLSLPAIDAYTQLFVDVNVRNPPGGDPWDRIGLVSLQPQSGAQVPLMPFMTNYGGNNSWTADITNLAPLLAGGNVTIQSSIVNYWTQNPAWNIDVTIRARNGTAPHATWAQAVVPANTEWQTRDFAGGQRQSYNVTIPSGLKSLNLTYFATGHCTDGTGSDEFTKHLNSIYVDGQQVFSKTPWVVVGSMGRSGWWPGDMVNPYQINLSYLVNSPGQHTISYAIDNIRPDDGHAYGYWRVSSYLSGSTVPEPGTLTLLAIGLLAPLAWNWHRKRRKL